MSSNQQAIAYAVLNAVLVLLGQQLASGQYPIPAPWLQILEGIVALAVAALTAVSPFFRWGVKPPDPAQPEKPATPAA